jgi:hypothetical protein
MMQFYYKQDISIYQLFHLKLQKRIIEIHPRQNEREYEQSIARDGPRMVMTTTRMKCVMRNSHE